MKHMMIASLIVMSTSIMAQVAGKSSRELAKKLYISLTGTQPTTQELDYLEQKMVTGDLIEAGYDIVDQRGAIKNNGAFYGVTVKDWATPKFNKQKTKLAPLDDAIATIIGKVRDSDQSAFNTILFENSVYKAKGATFKGELWYFAGNTYPSSVSNASSYCTSVPAETGKYRIIYNNPLNPNDPSDKKCRVTKFTKAQLDKAYADNYLYIPHLDVMIETNLLNATNRHYESISEQGLDLGDPRLLGKNSQIGALHPLGADVSGLLTTRSFGSAYFFAGTNRAPVAYAMEHFLCKDMEELNDTTIPDFRNRQDVDRSPGGTSELYKNRCVGCHAGMDALAGAFAYYDYVGGQVKYFPNKVVTKMVHNDNVFPAGFRTSNDSWMNLWSEGQNKILGWPTTVEGSGVQGFGRLLAYTEAFHSCMAKQAYEAVCMRKAETNIDKERVKKLTASYKSSNYNMKKLFINSSIECLED